ncbi:MAG: LLM class flavin-dependent oxidoreductase [Pseudomonadota bacterium]
MATELEPLHLGTTPWNFRDLTAASLAGQARRAEALGYQSFWLPENHFNEQALPDPLMLLASCAAVTDRLRLGTTSYLLTLRNPIQAAEQVAVLDQLSGGRVTLGVGRGFAPAMLAAYGVESKEKRRIFERCLKAMQAAWQGQPLAEALPEDHLEMEQRASLESVILHPQPVQRPHPPVWVAAFGPKALAQAGRLGLPYLASPMETLAQLVSNWNRHREAGAEAGVPAPDVVPVMRSVLIADDEQLLRRVREGLAGTMRGPAGVEAGPVDEWALIGTVAQVRDRLLEYQQELGLTHLIATRLRLEGIPADAIADSMVALRELVPEQR